jgi:hypothetical protein
MSKQADTLMDDLRELLLKALADADAPGKVVNPVFDALLKDHRTDFWELIENFSNEQWSIGTSDGCVTGLRRAREVILAAAGEAFAARKDDDAHGLRKAAALLDAEVTKAEARAKTARKERGA